MPRKLFVQGNEGNSEGKKIESELGWKRGTNNERETDRECKLSKLNQGRVTGLPHILQNYSGRKKNSVKES